MLLLNPAGALKAMPAKLVSDDGLHVVIGRSYTLAKIIARLYQERELPSSPAAARRGDCLFSGAVKKIWPSFEIEHAGEAVDVERSAMSRRGIRH